jgi:hypothetical protein
VIDDARYVCRPLQMRSIDSRATICLREKAACIGMVVSAVVKSLLGLVFPQ